MNVTRQRLMFGAALARIVGIIWPFFLAESTHLTSMIYLYMLDLCFTVTQTGDENQLRLSQPTVSSQMDDGGHYAPRFNTYVKHVRFDDM